ncbi:putative Alpha/Beta hydrolase protein [Seiridium unicorne]|uniref:Alpha/Beta hydrolase protein n=1 Tax=Seiridium unicorne TaxID=138068 RepID=A0ABR2UW94_9PEZI
MANIAPDGSDVATTKSITVQTETDLSLLYRILRTVIKPLRPRLVKPGKRKPAGSPRLDTYPRTKGSFTISERQHDGSRVWLYDFEPESPPTIKIKPPSTIYYFAGGGFQSPPSGEHWSYLSKLAGALTLEHHITLVSYPLAPASPASESLPVLRRLFTSIFAEAAKKGDKITLMGDSAGGNIAASIGFWWAKEIESSNNWKLNSVLQSVVLVSPAMDLRNSNPAMKDVDRLDPLLGAAYTGSVARAWVAAPPDSPHLTSSPEDPDISPLLHEPSSFRLLAEMGISVHCVYGTHDVLAPDVELFKQRCEEFGVKGRWLVWIGQMHCFVLAGAYGMSEGKKAIEWLVEVLKSDDIHS